MASKNAPTARIASAQNTTLTCRKQILGLLAVLIFVCVGLDSSMSAQANPTISSYTVTDPGGYGCTYTVNANPASQPCNIGPGDTLVVNGANFLDLSSDPPPIVILCDCPYAWPVTNYKQDGTQVTVIVPFVTNPNAGVHIETSRGLYSEPLNVPGPPYNPLGPVITNIQVGTTSPFCYSSSQMCSIAVGQTVTITGNYFGATTQGTSGLQVSMGDGANANIVSWTNTQIVVTAAGVLPNSAVAVGMVGMMGWSNGIPYTAASNSTPPTGMVLYPNGTTTPKRQVNVFGGPINNDPTTNDYALLVNTMGTTTGILNSMNLYNPAFGSGYITGVTSSLDLGCGANCTAAAATYLDHVGANANGQSCPSLDFAVNSNAPDNFLKLVQSAGYINNLILVNASYGVSSSTGNVATPQYVWTQDWANNIDNDCVHQDSSLNRSYLNGAFVLPGDYIYVPATTIGTTSYPQVYFQFQSSGGCGGGSDSNDIRCQLASAPPSCITDNTAKSAGQTCVDRAVTWTNISSNAPPLDGWCDSTYPGVNCADLIVSGSGATIIGTVGSPFVAKIPVTAEPTYLMGQSVTVANITGTIGGQGKISDYFCNGCTITAVTYSPDINGKYWVSYTLPLAIQTTHMNDTLTWNNHACTDNVPAGCTTVAHSVNFNMLTNPATFNMSTGAALSLLQTTMPIPWEQPNRQRVLYLFSQVDAHYNAHSTYPLGYVRLGLTKGGEAVQDGIANWPANWLGGAYGKYQYASYEKLMYAFMGAHGCGIDFACVGNLFDNPSPNYAFIPVAEARNMYNNNIGLDNNALQANHAYTLQSCSTHPLPQGALYHGGDWAQEFLAYYNLAQGNQQIPVTTLQTSLVSTPTTCKTSCSNPCNSGSQSCSGQGDTGAMSLDPASTCTTATGTQFPSGYPGNLPIADQYFANNIELYFCDALLALNDYSGGVGVNHYETSHCASKVSPQTQGNYQGPYQHDFNCFIQGVRSMKCAYQ